jgi:hypothetical protein
MMGDLSIACKLQEKHVYSLHPRGCFVSRKNLRGSTYLQATTQHSGKAMKIGKFTADGIRKQQDIKGKQFTTWIMLNLKLSHSQTNLAENCVTFQTSAVSHFTPVSISSLSCSEPPSTKLSTALGEHLGS